jgi:CheY-specific phosphatase CheX
VKAVLSEVLADAARLSVIEVFQAYGVSLKPKRSASGAPAFMQAANSGAVIVASVVGFGGPDFRGTALIATSFELTARARPPAVSRRALSPNSAADWIVVRDWIGELGNQLVGRIKNKIMRYGISFEIAPPASFSGSTLTFAVPRSPNATSFAFEAGDQSVWMCLDALFDASRQVSPASEETTVAEGKVVVFE